jgi:hypothetical protein
MATSARMVAIVIAMRTNESIAVKSVDQSLAFVRESIYALVG